MTPIMVNQQLLLFFFSTVKLDATNSCPSNTAYLSENGPHHEKTCFCHVNNKGTDQPVHPRSLINAFGVRCLDSNKILQLNAI